MVYQNVPHYSSTINSTRGAKLVARVLIQKSVYFVVLPLPDDDFMFSVKIEDKNTLDRIISDVTQEMAR